MKSKKQIICVCIFILSLFSINIHAQKTADDLGRLVFQSFKSKQVQSIDKYLITHNQLLELLKEDNKGEVVLTKENYEMVRAKIKDNVESIYNKGIKEGIDWSDVELISVESDINNHLAIITILISYERYEIEIKSSLNVEQQGKWYLGPDISSNFTKYDYKIFDGMQSVDSLKGSSVVYLETGIYELSKDTSGFLRLLLGSTDSLYVKPNKIIPVSSIANISYSKSKSAHGFSIKMELDEIGKVQLAELTERNLFNRIAFVFNNNLIQAPTVMMKMETGILVFENIHMDKSDIELIVKQIKKSDSNRKK